MSLLDRKRQGPRASASKRDSPLQRLRLKAGLTTSDLAERFRVSTATISRWLAGDRAAPRAFIAALQKAAIGDVSEVEAAQEQYRQERRRREKPPTLEIALPPGIEPEEARRLALEAIRNATARARAQAEVGSS
jgi:transcriptional regulator with XRE-family HTH domain